MFSVGQTPVHIQNILWKAVTLGVSSNCNTVPLRAQVLCTTIPSIGQVLRETATSYIHVHVASYGGRVTISHYIKLLRALVLIPSVRYVLRSMSQPIYWRHGREGEGEGGGG